MRPASRGLNGADVPEELRPQPGDYTIIKPRWSAFFGTELDLILRRLGVRTVILAGTTTPNCVRTTCYDAITWSWWRTAVRHRPRTYSVRTSRTWRAWAR